MPHIPTVRSRARIAYPGAQYRIEEDCGHFPWLKRPGSVRKALEHVCG